MDVIEAFLGECRVDLWFLSHPEAVDRLESRVHQISTCMAKDTNGKPSGLRFTGPRRDNETPVDRCQALGVVLQGFIASGKTS
jgi:hypothetical protein